VVGVAVFVLEESVVMLMRLETAYESGQVHPGLQLTRSAEIPGQLRTRFSADYRELF
jgi:hypothetical protein